MIIHKVINNNTVSAVDAKNREIVVVGRGVGYKMHAGQAIDRTKIEKIFRMDTPDETGRLKKLFLEVDIESIEAATKILDYAHNILDKRLSKNAYITLTDHINFAIERFKQGYVFDSMLYWETQSLYPAEFEIGLYALEIIKQLTGVELPENEAGSIAVHIVNAEYSGDMNRTLRMTDIIKNAMNIVRYEFQVEFDVDSLDYSRFVTHLLFYAQRVVNGNTHQGEDTFLYDTMKAQYPKALRCAHRIGAWTEKTFETTIKMDEITFLCIHIARITANHAGEADKT